MKSFGSVLAAERSEQQIRLRGADATLALDFLSARQVRMRLQLAGLEAAGQTVALARRDEPPLVAVEEGDPYTVRTAELVVTVQWAPLQVTVCDLAGGVVLRCVGLAWEPVADDGRCRVQARFRRATEEHYYGLGQAGPSLDKDGTTRRLWNSHYGYGPGSDMAVPLVVSSRGYGLFFDNSWDAELDLGRTEETASLVYTAEGGQLDIYLLYGPDPKTILAEYAELTGYPPMPPRWALGYIQSTRHFYSAEDIVELGRTLRDRRIPCDAIVFLSTYGDDMGMNNGVGTLDFHPRLWADPAGVLGELKAQHLRVVSHEYPVLSPKSALFDEASRSGYLVLDYAGSTSSVMFNEGQRYLDFTNPAVGAWWWAAHQSLIDLGVDGWWLDGGEGPPSSVQLHAGGGRALHNVFDLYRQQAFVDGERRTRPNQRPWLLCRSGYAAMQRLGSATWSGDINNTFDVFEAQLPLGLSTAMSGVPYWGTDIGGFFHTVPETAELFVRWFQFAAFSPVFRSHGRGVGHEGWREHLPWAHGPHVEEICRTFGELRYRMFPYNYSLAWQAHTRGTPLMRPLVLEFPDDQHVVDMSSEYLWGPSLLVAPVTRGGATRWPVYLPEGAWYDFWTHERHEGGGWIEVGAPLERLPVLVRAGAIVPLGPPMQFLDSNAGPLTLLIYPEGTSSFELYEDDGETWEYEQGVYALTVIQCAASVSGVRLSLATQGRFTPRTVSAEVYLPAPPSRVTLDGQVLPRRDGAGGWSHDGERCLRLSFVQGAPSVEIEISA